jgi:uncharacterized protein (TIGR03435 family)
VASIKPSKADADSTAGIHSGRGRLEASNVTLKRCIMGAFGVGPQLISGGPDWLDAERFEISAKAEQPVGDPVLMSMLQNLLAERFKLAVHRETRTISAYLLEVARNGPKMDKAPPGESGTNTTTSNTGVTIDAHNTDMDALARILARRTELLVVNRTELEGIFNFKLHWTPDSMRVKDGLEGPSIFTALQEQLGLRLRAGKTGVEILVIDHAEKPSPN